MSLPGCKVLLWKARSDSTSPGSGGLIPADRHRMPSLLAVVQQPASGLQHGDIVDASKSWRHVTQIP
jgi:hypothetical protein